MGAGRARIPASGATIRTARAVSSAGRAPALHAGGRRFESCTAHEEGAAKAALLFSEVTPRSYAMPSWSTDSSTDALPNPIEASDLRSCSGGAVPREHPDSGEEDQADARDGGDQAPADTGRRPVVPPGDDGQARRPIDGLPAGIKQERVESTCPGGEVTSISSRNVSRPRYASGPPRQVADGPPTRQLAAQPASRCARTIRNPGGTLMVTPDIGSRRSFGTAKLIVVIAPVVRDCGTGTT